MSEHFFHSSKKITAAQAKSIDSNPLNWNQYLLFERNGKVFSHSLSRRLDEDAKMWFNFYTIKKVRDCSSEEINNLPPDMRNFLPINFEF